MKLMLLIGAALLLGYGALNARARVAPPGQTAVEIKATKVAGSVYLLEGQGGNIGATVGPDGALIVDDQFAPLSEKIRAKLSELGAGRLKFVLNTHFHGDHTGGNANFGKEATIVAHANVRRRLSGELKPVASQAANLPPKEALPVVTFDESLAVHFNGEEIRAMHYPRSHTDGDSAYLFTGSNVAHLGDLFVNGKFPFVDASSGGDLAGLTRTVADLISKLPADVKIIPGHGPLATLDDLKRYHRMLTATTAVVRQKMNAGKTLEQVKAEGLPDEWKSWDGGFVKTDRWLETVYRGLSGSKGAQ
jgi:cyclase